ncbi:DUF1707 SHOCT-like domain-containing protein [Geodermatophilus marinus]|uniref:DUF1707 SHOCT-like domain-containing protein n=1 Tax=Geodermatophilus sp. LHW52908 TaxID=2303986 RepID=UPI000E3D7310|nr:DUF1707 domain-containing protein [Geodermatophilus sp. LHW52908]RFU22895.1 DUF1707 and DUF2154 domain-containing protein [Geodermatophilus sp. LHW52908]
MTPAEQPPDREHPAPAVRISDADREAVVARLQRAVAEGRIDLGEFGERVEAAYAAVTAEDLAGPVADLPAEGSPEVEIVGSRPPSQVDSVFGDIRLTGAGAAPERAHTVFGDIRLDLRDLRTREQRIEIELSTWFGDVDVVVPEGVDAELIGRTVFGDRVVDLAPVPRLEGTPRIVVRARAVFGDLRLRSLAPGESASRWRALVERLAARHLPPAPTPPPAPRAPTPPPAPPRP